MTAARRTSAPIWTFLLLTVAFSSPFWTVILRTGHMGSAHSLPLVALMWCPAAAALATALLMDRPIASFGWRWPRFSYLTLAYLLPVGYAGVVYGTVWLLGAGAFDPTSIELPGSVSESAAVRLAAYIAITATVGVIANAVYALGEEIGWRGFLVPQLAERMSFTRVSVASGIIWTAWHGPELLFADYNAGTNAAYAFACFAVMTIAASVVFAWLRLKSRSIWPAVLLHASHNAFIHGVFDNAMRDTGATRWWTTEFGAGMALSMTVCAAYFWMRRREVP